jgi:hypothetical protein
MTSVDNRWSRAERKEEALWLIEELAPGTGCNNLSLTFQVDGRLDVSALETAVARLVARHDVLRTVFRAEPDGLVKRVLDEVDVPVLLPAATADLEADLRAFVAEPLPLDGRPLVRAGLLRRPEGDVCCLVAHHLIFDVISASVVAAEIVADYEAARAGAPRPVEVVPAEPNPPLREADLAFWQEHLRGLDRPGGTRAGTVRSLTGGQVTRTLGVEAAETVRNLARQARAPEIVVLLAAYYLLLASSGAGDDLVVSFPLNVRPPAAARAVGYHVNLLPLRVTVDRGGSFADLVARTRTVFFDAVAHSGVPAETIVSEALREHDSWRNRLFRHAFNYLPPSDTTSFSIDGHTATPVLVENGYSKFDLEFCVIPSSAGLRVRAVHVVDALDRSEVDELLRRYDELFAAVGANPSSPLTDVVEWREVRRDDGVPATLQSEVDDDDELVRELVDVWCELLGRDDLTAASNFFSSGGHSVLAAQLAQQVEARTGREVGLADVFTNPAPGLLAAHLRAAAR